MATTKKQATAIQSASINRVEDKSGKCLGYLVRSDSKPNTYYNVTWEPEAMGWRCTCPSRVSCKHVRAVREYVEYRYRHPEQHRKEEVKKSLLPSEKGSLNGGGKAFSLLK